MGYTTKFKGVLKFDHELTVDQILKLDSILGEDVRDHPEWNVPKETWLTYIDLQATNDLTGLEWDNSEKTYGMELAVDLVIRLMKEEFPEFSLTGDFLARGEDFDDNYYIHVNKNIVSVEKL